MADAILRIKTVMDMGDAVSNVSTLQKALSKLKLPDNLKDNLTKNISSFYKEYDKYQKRLSDGIKTQGDYNQIEKSLNRLKSLYADIGKDAAKAVKIDPAALFDLDEGKFKGIVDKIENTLKQLSDVKIDTKAFTGPIEEIAKLTKNQKIVGEGGILNRMMGHLETGNISEAKKEYESLMQTMQKAAPKFDEFGNKLNKPGTFSVAHYEQLKGALDKLGTALLTAGKDTKPLEEELNRLQAELAETISLSSKDLIGNVGDYNKQAAGVEKVTDSLRRMHEEEYSFNRQAQDIDRQIQTYFGLSQMIRKVGEIARDAFQTVKELDAAMVETAVVTNFDVGDMWDMLPTYTANANQLGATIKDVYEAATLYFQQGLNLSQSMGLANETLKMARIGGLQAAEATNMMTAALRGFNMEINQLSAKRINDVYSELAAITAADTKEIGSAMERTASIANSANMEFETTSAFLAQMIETTREAPENLGTAMKTIIARFQEMKQDPTKLVDSEGVALDANKIDTALKTIGVDLKNQKGEFRDLDDVFLDISERWDSLTQGQQRYIATIAAGSRQQSRFIAMMQNYERVKELVDAANNSAGAGQKQFEKTLEGLSAKLNKLKNAWDQFTMGLMNSQVIKTGVDALTGFFTVVNKLFDLLTKPIPDPFGGLIKSAITLGSTLMMLNLGKKGARGAVMAGVGWWKGEGKITDNFRAGWGVGTKQNKKQKESEDIKTIQKQIRQQQLDKRLSANAKTQFIETPVVSKAYLKKIDDSKLHPLIKQEIEKELDKPITEDVKVKVNALIDKGNVENPEALKITDADIQQGGKGLDEFGNKFSDLGVKISSAGMQLQQFGDSIGGPFGSALSTVGTLMMTLGTTMDMLGVSFKANIAAEKEAILAKQADAKATGILSIAQTKGAVTARAFGKALWASLGPLALIAAAIGVAVIAFKTFDALHVSKKEELEATTDAAAAASEAFDLAKQETSELTDAISRIQETDNAFDNLVVGTAEFNEQLVTANQQITELLQKYPMLNDPKYLSTDENGLMHINEAGLKAVKEYQKQIQARASATNIIQAADLAALENRQKAERLEQKSWGLDQDEINKNKENAKLLRDRAKAETELARVNAIRTSLQGQEISDVEAIASVYADLYEEKRKAAEIDVESMGKHDIRQAYADYHGYKYNKSTSKMRDAEGNEVDYDDKVLKDEVIENTVLLDFEANAASLDVVLNDLDRKFRDTLGGAFEGSEHVISDILSGNIETNTDILEQILGENSTELQDLVNNLSEEEVAAILGISVEEVKNTDFDKVTDLLTEKAINLADAQSESYSKLAAMMAQDEFGTVQKAQQGNQNIIREAIKELTTQQAATLSTIGQTLDQNVGSEATAAFIDKATDIYLGGTEDQIKEFDNILNEINWESAASRLEGYNKMINSSDDAIRHLGESMRNSADEANLVGEAFDEFVSGDWEKLSENADNFKNAMGQIDGAGIMKAAEQSKSLKALLDSGEVSATAVAQALQGIEDGKYSVGAVDTAVLQLISSLNRLEDIATEAHNIIENFDPGIDYSESEDFLVKNAEAAKKLMEDQKWGNPQLQNYIKLAAGLDVWNEAYLRHKGDMEATTKELSGIVTQFTTGLNDAYDKLEAGEGLNGKSISENLENSLKAGNIDGELKKKLESVKVWWDENGDLQFTFPEDFTTADMEAYYKYAAGLSEEYAKIFLEDLANYTDTEMSRLQAGDLKQTLTSAEFQKQVARNEQGQGIITDAQFNILKDIGGAKALEEVAVALGYVADESETAADKLSKNLFETLKDGKEITDGLDLARRYAQTYHTDETGGKASARSLAKVEEFQDAQGRLDISKLTTGFEKVMSSQQAFQASWETYRKLDEQGKTMSYNGQELAKNIATPEEYQAAISELADKSQWYDVGQSIAEGIISYMNSNKNQDAKEDTKLSDDEKTGFHFVDWLKQRQKEKEAGVEEKPTTTTPSDYSPSKFLGGTGTTLNFDAQTAQINAKIKQINDAFGGLMDGIKPESINSPEARAALNSVFKTAMDGQAQDLTTELKSSLNILGISVEDAFNAGLIKDTKIKDSSQKAGEKLAKDAATGIEDGTKKYTGGGAHGGAGQKTPGRAQEAQAKGKVTDSIANVQEAVVKVTTQEVGLKETKDKVDKLKDAASKQQTIKIGAQVNKTANTALDSIKKIREAVKKKNTVNVDAKVKGKEDTNNLGSVIKNVKPKAVSVKANVSGANKVSTLKNQLNNLPTRKDIYITTHKSTKHDTGAKGINNYIPHRSAPSLGSLAKGSRYGRLGPKGRGGLTLTGEKGFEIAWLPSESRSMILGAEGPQMLNLPSDAVVYTHEQSKDILKKKQTIDAGSHSGRNKGGGGKSGSKKGKKKNKKKNKNKNKNKNKGTINNFSIEEVVRFNLEPELSRLTEQIADRTKEIEKILTGIGKTYDDIVGSANKQVDALNQVKEKNKALYDSYARQLADFRGQKGSVSWTDDKGKSHDKTINIGDWVDANGVINQAKIAALGSRAEQEATFNFLNSSVKNWVDGMANADKAMKDAQEQIDDLGKKISEAFYQWKNELTEVYDLTQRINNETSFTDRFASQVELELAKLSSGFGDTAQSISNIRAVMIRSNATIKEQIKNQQQMIAARQRELEAAISYEDEIERRQKYEASNFGGNNAVKEATVAAAREEEAIAIGALKYVKNVFKDIDGSIQYTIDWQQFNTDRDANPINKTTYEKIKQYLDDLATAEQEFNNAIKTQTDFIKQTYESLKEYQETIVDFEDKLIDGLEEEIKNETENAKKISSSVANALKDLLDEVKRKLDERRQQEDNARTERDISQKQQRLAALRADTAGGHQVEIAQLEKEIAEAQQDYGRTLEDQLLARLEQQADEAQKQRERQIELAETSNEIAASNNKELVDMWLRDPETYKEEIKAAWLEANGYDEKGEAGQYVLEKQFESDFANLVNAVDQTGFSNHFKTFEDDTNSLVALLQELTEGDLGRIDEKALDTNALLDATARNTESILTELKRSTLAQLRSQGVDAQTLKSIGYTAKDLISQGGYDANELQKAGFTAKEVYEGGITDAGTLKNAGYNAKDIKDAGGFDAADLKAGGFNAKDLEGLFGVSDLKDLFNIGELKNAGYTASDLKPFYNASQLKGSGYSAEDLKKAGFDKYTIGATGYTYDQAKAAGWTMYDLRDVSQYATAANNEIAAKAAADAAAEREAAYQNKLAAAVKNGKTSWKEIQEVEKVANNAGHGARTWIPALAAKDGAGGLTWKEIFKAIKGHWNKYRIALSFSSSAAQKAYNAVWGSGSYNKDLKKAQKDGYAPYAYKTGGLADYTGPAWLDGTPSKPELVLNAADTKNFLALKDVLSRAIHSSNSVSNSYGDATYEININVDHLNNDYDVDRVAERVKKIIVKDAGYRNVTQVRNFR